MNTWERLQIVVAAVTTAAGMYRYLLGRILPDPEKRDFSDYFAVGVATLIALVLSAMAVGGVYATAYWIIYGYLP